MRWHALNMALTDTTNITRSAGGDGRFLNLHTTLSFRHAFWKVELTAYNQPVSFQLSGGSPYPWPPLKTPAFMHGDERGVPCGKGGGNGEMGT